MLGNGSSLTEAEVDATGAETPRVTGQPVAVIADAHRYFGAQHVLRGMSLTIGEGEFVAMLGHSGSGKSTILRALAGLDPDVSGQVEVKGIKTVVFQSPRLLPWRSVLANVVLALTDRDRLALGRLALAEVGLSDKEQAWPVTLSGGEAQRVALARALVRQPSLLLLDEPFAALDALTRIRMYRLLKKLVRRHRPAVLHVTHDVDEAILLADRVVVLERGIITHQEMIDRRSTPRRSDPTFIQVRTRLLRVLGVSEELSDSVGTGEVAGPPGHVDEV